MDNKISQFIFEKVGIPKAKQYLNLSSLRHKLVSSNIANVSTPGYRSKDINFESEFQKLTNNSSHLAGTMTNENHIPTGQNDKRPPKIQQAKIEQGEMNSVDIDQEIPTLAQNELRYTIAATLLQRKFEGLRKVIQSK